MQVDPTDGPKSERPFLLSKRVRRVLFYAGLFVLYSQLVSAGLTGVYRYTPWEPTWLDGGHPTIFDPCTLTLLQPPEGIGTIENWRAVGWNIEFSPARYIAWAAAAPILGSAALFFASVAGAGWRPRALLFVGSCLGVAAAVAIKIHEAIRGSISWAIVARRFTDGTLLHAPHPIYGYAELIGSLFLPIAIYMAIVVYILVSSARVLLRWSMQRVRTRQAGRGP
ncbi:MAG: hypothetical protein AB7S71_14805 [Dongiaceae bacterium]